MVAKALEGKATAKREVGKVVASSMELVTGVENGATRNRDVGGKMSTWSGSVVEEEEDDAVESANLESLEMKRGEWRALCSLENRFAVMMNVDEEGHDDNEAPASETVVPQEDNDWVHVLNKKNQ